MQKDSLLCNRSALVVAGNATLREMIAKAVSSWGMMVRAVSNYEEASNALKRDHFDFVILDAFLPDREGQSAALDLKAVKVDATFIIMLIPIGYNISREPFISGWITKPVKPRQLHGVIRNLLTLQDDSMQEQHQDRSRLPRKAEEKTLHILLAEDNLVNQKVALRMLKILGYKADVAVNGLEVLQALGRQPYDVILMDIQMPEMDGLEAARRVRKIPGKQPFIVAMTAYAMDGDRDLCLQAGMDEYIRKPIKIEELQKVLERLSQGPGKSQ